MSGLFSEILSGLSGSEQQNADPVKNALTDVLGLNNPNGISGLLSQFSNNGLGQHVMSWIGNGQNTPITAEDVQSVLSNEQVQALIQKTGLPVEALMPLVAKLLPHTVDQATPDGQVPQGGTTNA
jgi:uncharacterized protein YidB (DUF937 family)